MPVSLVARPAGRRREWFDIFLRGLALPPAPCHYYTGGQRRTSGQSPCVRHAQGRDFGEPPARDQHGSNQTLSQQEVELTRQPVELFKVLKLSGLAGSGGEAKMLIAAGAITVNGEVETRKRRKIIHGDRIAFEQELLKISCPEAPSPAAAGD